MIGGKNLEKCLKSPPLIGLKLLPGRRLPHFTHDRPLNYQNTVHMKWLYWLLAFVALAMASDNAATGDDDSNDSGSASNPPSKLEPLTKGSADAGDDSKLGDADGAAGGGDDDTIRQPKLRSGRN